MESSKTSESLNLENGKTGSSACLINQTKCSNSLFDILEWEVNGEEIVHIGLGGKNISKQSFDNITDALQYIEEKPWELISNLCLVILMNYESTKKQMSEKVRKTIITILIAIGSFIGGVVGQRNKAIGELIDTVVTTVGLNLVENGQQSDTIKVDNVSNNLIDTTIVVDTTYYRNGSFTVVAFDTFTVISKINKMNLPKRVKQ